MAKRTLGNLPAMNKVLYAERLQKTEELTRQLEQNGDLSEEYRDEIIYLTDDQLLDDPENTETYGENDVQTLAEVMRISGFQGVILAYPYEDKYMIESGHRRREAARRAGLEKYRVYVTEPPKFEWERTQRRIRANKHNRPETPMTLAKEAEMLYRSHENEIKYKKENNLLQENEITSINELVALDMGINKKSVELYRRLNKLIPELQEMCASKEYAWSAIAMASNMEIEKQKKLYDLIVEKAEKTGADSVDRKWISDKVDKLKQGIDLDKIERPVEKQARPKGGEKYICKFAGELKSALECDKKIKKKDCDKVIDTLEELKKSIEKKIEELNEQKLPKRKRTQPNG